MSFDEVVVMEPLFQNNMGKSQTRGRTVVRRFDMAGTGGILAV